MFAPVNHPYVTRISSWNTPPKNLLRLRETVDRSSVTSILCGYTAYWFPEDQAMVIVVVTSRRVPA